MENSDLNEKELLDKEKKTDEKIKETYEIILNRKERQLSSSMNIFIKATALIKIALFIVIIVIKYENQSDYFTASDIHDKYNQFMLLISRFSLKFKQLNLYMYQNVNTVTASYMFNALKNQPLIGASMDNFLYMFDIPTVS